MADNFRGSGAERGMRRSWGRSGDGWRARWAKRGKGAGTERGQCGCWRKSCARGSAVDLLCPGGWPNRHATPEGLNYFSSTPPGFANALPGAWAVRMLAQELCGGQVRWISCARGWRDCLYFVLRDYPGHKSANPPSTTKDVRQHSVGPPPILY